MIWMAFFVGLFVGGTIGLVAMCLCIISGDESRKEELRDVKTTIIENKGKGRKTL